MRSSKGIPVILMSIYLVWYATPFFRYIFSGGYNTIFIGVLFLGLIFYALIKCNGQVSLSGVSSVALAYCVVIVYMGVIGYGNAMSSIRIITSYWFPLFLFTVVEQGKNEDVGYFVKLAIAIVVITALTTYFNLLINPSISRSLTASNTSQEVVYGYQSKNCGDIYLVQSMVLLVPFLLNNIKKKLVPLLNWAVLIFIAVFLIHASFTISLFVYIATVLFSLICMSNTDRYVKVLLISIVVFGLVINMEAIIEFLYGSIDNAFIKERLNTLLSMLNGEKSDNGRFDYNKMSYETFIKNPLGVGPFYFEKCRGIGNHSQILDDLARYGVFAILFYAVFFVNYYKLLIKRWSMIGSNAVVLPYMLSMIVFLTLNPGFRGSAESVVTLLIMPGLPYVLGKQKQSEVRPL